MLANLRLFLTYSSYLLLLISLLICFVHYKKYGKSISIYCRFLILYAITEIFANLLWFKQINNLPLLHAYTLLEFIIWSFFYRTLLPNKKLVTAFFQPYFLTVSVLIVLNSFFLEPLTGFNSNAKTLVQILIIGYAIYYLFNAYGKVDFSKVPNNAIMLINFAVIIYYSGSLFIFMFSKALLNADANQQFFWTLNGFLMLVFHILSLTAIYKVSFQVK